MSQQNVEIAKAATDAYNRRDLDAWLAHFDREIVWWAMADEPEPGPFQGHEAVLNGTPPAVMRAAPLVVGLAD